MMIAKSPRSNFADALRQAAVPIGDPNDMPKLFNLIGEARIVMLGEATHGTSEFYEWRRIISEQLIRDHGFSFIAVEGDWPDCQRIHQHITIGKGSPREALAGYRRFPTWMWGNEEVLELVEWLRGWNDRNFQKSKRPRVQSSTSRSSHGKSEEHTPLNSADLDFGLSRQVGFHGLDVYSLFDSAKLVIDYLERVDPGAAPIARRAYECFERFGDDPQHYAYGLRFVPSTCEREVTEALSHMDRLRELYSRINPDHVDPGEAYFDARMNALVTRNAEAYYRIMVGGDAESWNVRDRHMMETLILLLDHYGKDSRAIVWAHNTHIGDYRATDMKRAGYVNLGGLARELFGEEAVRLIGFGTHRGTVIAAPNWGDPPQVMNVPDAMEGSLEEALHQLRMPQTLIALRELPAAAREAINVNIGHRAIGVVYNPRYERRGQYVPTHLADRYDAFIFLDDTHAVHPLGIAADEHEEAQAWPSGM